MILTNVDLSQPLTDHPFWRDVRGVWLPIGNLAGKNILYDLSPYHEHLDASLITEISSSTTGFYYETGANKYIECSTDIWGGLNEFTIVCRCRVDTSSIYGDGIVGAWDTATQVLLRVTNGKLQFFAYPGSQQYVEYVINNYGYLHVTAIYDGSALRLYLDGQQKATTSASGTINTGGGLWRLGIDDRYTTSNYLQGAISDTFMWPRALTPSEVAFFHDQSLRGYPDLIAQTTGRLTCYITKNPIGFASNVPA